MSNTSQQRTKPADMPAFGDMDPAMLDGLNGPKSMGALVPIKNEIMMQMQGEIITAQKVVIERNLAKIMANIKIKAAAAGTRWFYRIPFKDRKTGQTTYVEGISIKGANGVFREYGNCKLSVRVQDAGTHWVITPCIIDYETGSSYERPFQQRKGQDTGMSDSARREDAVFGIGISKSSRNVINNFLEDLCDFAFEEAKKGLVARINGNPEGAKKWIIGQLAEMQIDVKRVSAVYGRSPDHWSVPDMAKIYAEINGILDGMVDAIETYPMVDGATAEPKSGPQGAPPADQPTAPPALAAASAGPAVENGVAGAGGATKPAGMTFAQIEDMLRKAENADAFDFARSHIKDMPLDQIKELSALASTLYAERFSKDRTDKAAPKKSDKPPLFE